MDRPEIRYTKTVDGVHIAYQVFGDGPIDHGLQRSARSRTSTRAWELPEIASYFRRLASFSRVIAFDRRGNGNSDRDLGSSHRSKPAWTTSGR